MVRTTRGFTIVELLIVIVVIGILAAITIVAFNGIQTRAANTKTLSAAASYVKGLQVYYNTEGDWPGVVRACLGEGYPYGFGGTGGTTQCRTTAPDVESASLHTDLRKYMSSLPTPDMTAIGSSTDWFRGILMFSSTGSNRILAVSLRGVTTCPTLSGTTIFAEIPYAGDRSCRYEIQV